MVIIARIGDFVKHHKELLWRAFIMLCIGWSAYNIGLIEAQRGVQPAQSSVLLRTRESIVSQAPAVGEGGSIVKSDRRVVTSKNSSSKKYHYSWCASGKRIKDTNRIWFPSEKDALQAGYTLAGNCLP
ncbi:MAG: hypothetical protein KBC02_03850 [Candidatus Pacebacteria bacterium]|nr:hypothetical protein [Candidatus Paceibacterota bacterium]